MNKYIYSDKRKTPPKVVFECEAPNILEADKLYKKATGNDPAQQPYVGCESKEVPEAMR